MNMDSGNCLLDEFGSTPAGYITFVYGLQPIRTAAVDEMLHGFDLLEEENERSGHAEASTQSAEMTEHEWFKSLLSRASCRDEQAEGAENDTTEESETAEHNLDLLLGARFSSLPVAA
ncbi:MAG TPA: hypothetical protein V6C69_07355 [Trichormus sp.]|jgi:hypothetical protein